MSRKHRLKFFDSKSNAESALIQIGQVQQKIVRCISFFNLLIVRSILREKKTLSVYIEVSFVLGVAKYSSLSLTTKILEKSEGCSRAFNISYVVGDFNVESEIIFQIIFNNSQIHLAKTTNSNSTELTLEVVSKSYITNPKN